MYMQIYREDITDVFQNVACLHACMQVEVPLFINQSAGFYTTTGLRKLMLSVTFHVPFSDSVHRQIC